MIFIPLMPPRFRPTAARFLPLLAAAFATMPGFPAPAYAQNAQAAAEFREGNRLVHEGKYAEAKERFERGVAAGDAACMDYLGYLYLEGFGTTARPWIAYGLFREAAELGNDQACRNLGNMYFGGRGIEPSVPDAAKWWRLGAERGAPRAARSLADLLYAGYGIAQDQAQAVALWEQAAAKGNAGAEAALLYHKSIAGEGDASDHLQRLDALAKQGSNDADSVARFLKLRQSGKLDHYVELPYEPQAHNFCAVASSSLLARFGGLDTTQFDLARAAPRPIWGKGAGWDTMAAIAAQKGQSWKVESVPYTDGGFDEGIRALLAELAAGRPVLVDILPDKNGRSAHTIVLVGHSAEAGEFAFRDQAWNFPGIHMINEAEFKEIWRSRGFIRTNRDLRRPLMRSVP